MFWISDDVYSDFQGGAAETNTMYIPRDPPLVLHIANILTVSIVGQ